MKTTEATKNRLTLFAAIACSLFLAGAFAGVVTQGQQKPETFKLSPEASQTWLAIGKDR